VSIVVASHGHCFDGLTSAVLFTRLMRQLGHPTAHCEYRAVGYGPGVPERTAELFTGKLNALLDYRFNPASSLDWYFDHHRTAFTSDSERAVFDARTSSGQFFHDGEYSSCAKLIRDVSRDRFAVTSPELEELVQWADTIDSARFASAAEAIDHGNPILRLASVVEHHGDDTLLRELVPALLERPFSEVTQSARVKELYAPLAGERERYLDLVQRHAQPMGRVVFVDLTSVRLRVLAKFVTYALYPQQAYSVIVGRVGEAIKVSIGHNPWCGIPLDHDLGNLCAGHGGGGHAAVGAIAFPASAAEHAMAVARGIARDLAEGNGK
jgi:hypothetical protein